MKEKRSLIVDDVHVFPGHIACDSNSRSEIIIPLVKNEKAIGILDIDSPLLGRFDDKDRSNLENIASILINSL